MRCLCVRLILSVAVQVPPMTTRVGDLELSRRHDVIKSSRAVSRYRFHLMMGTEIVPETSCF